MWRDDFWVLSARMSIFNQETTKGIQTPKLRDMAYLSVFHNATRYAKMIEYDIHKATRRLITLSRTKKKDPPYITLRIRLKHVRTLAHDVRVTRACKWRL